MPEKVTNDVQQQLDILIQCLEGNLKFFSICKAKLNISDQRELLYTIVVELKKVCEICMLAFKPGIRGNG